MSHQVFDPSFLKFSLPVCLLTVITNTWAIVAIQHKNDQTVITITNIITITITITNIMTVSPQVIQGMIVLDCLNNMAFAAIGTFQQSPRCPLKT